MIDDLDRAVEELLKRELSPGLVEQVGISFAAPDSEFPPSSVPLPAVDLFLYDIRENLELRNTGWTVEYADDGTAVRKRNPVRVDCSYLMLLRHPTLPEALLQGSLKGQVPPLPSSTLQPGRLQSVSEFWQALGGKPKAALNYTVTIGVVPDRAVDTERPVLDKTVKIRPEMEPTRQ